MERKMSAVLAFAVDNGACTNPLTIVNSRVLPLRFSARMCSRGA